ncbi:MAG: YdbL family protein [Desulfocapsa sp.]|nr:YdbL family protein [Desulfocapsa sp.]
MKIIVSFVLFGLLLVCQPAMALDLKNAKAQGLVGETKTGYLAPVKSSPEVQKLVSSINGKRKAHYKKISKRNKTSLSAVEQLAGKKAMKKTPAGQYINVNGAWKKK